MRLPALILLTLTSICTAQRLSSADEPAAKTDVARWHLAEPFWDSPVVYGESVLFFQEDPAAPANASLLLVPDAIERVVLANGSQTFEAGRDYTWQPGERRLVLPAGSRIPLLTADQLYPPEGSPRSYRHKAGDPSRNMLFDNEHWFHDQQVEITYRTSQRWQGYRPAQAPKALARTLEKLRSHRPVTIAVSGDSISAGLNASGVTAPSRISRPIPSWSPNSWKRRSTRRSSWSTEPLAAGGWSKGWATSQSCSSPSLTWSSWPTA